MRRSLFPAIAAVALALAVTECAKEEEEELAVDPAIIGTWYQLTAAGSVYFLARNPADSSLNRMVITQIRMVYNTDTMFSADSGFYAKDGDIGDSIPGLRYWTQYYYKVIPVAGKGNALCLLHNNWGQDSLPAEGVTMQNATARYCAAADTTAWKQ